MPSRLNSELNLEPELNPQPIYFFDHRTHARKRVRCCVALFLTTEPTGKMAEEGFHHRLDYYL